MEKLNAEYIKVALKCHSDLENKCEICPYKRKCCSIALSKDALALINSQEQRIKELTEENDKLYRLVDDKIQENKRLTEALKVVNQIAKELTNEDS